MLEEEILLQEHATLAVLADTLLRKVGEPVLQVEEIDRLRWQLCRVLTTHLAKEDRLLYPSLLSSPDSEAAALALQFSREMGGLAEAYRAYMREWTPDRIGAEPSPFAAETRIIVSALMTRIEREDRDLYPLMGRAARAAA